MKKDIKRCIGLWLAEGDTETQREITFTNNCFDLIKIFYRVVKKLSGDENLRLYIYRSSENADYRELEDVSINLYLDERATQTYYIFRVASTDLLEKWRTIVSEAKSNPEDYRFVLQGFFAGEGSIYEGKRNSRRLRISQGEKDEFLEKMLDHFSIDYYFRPDGRSYVITKKRNWDKFAELELCKLHPRKKRKFNRIYDNFGEEHYQKGHLKEETFKLLDDPYRTKELAEKFDRSQARLCDVLMELKRDGKIKDYKAGSQSYWIRDDQDAVIISEIKKKYLELLRETSLKVGEIADHFSIRKKSTYKNLYRLEELGLIKKEEHKWETIETEKEVIVL